MTLPRPGLSLRARAQSVATLVLLLGADATSHAQRRPSAALEFGQRWSGSTSAPSCQSRGPNGDYLGEHTGQYCQWFVHGYPTKSPLSALVYDDRSVVTWEPRVRSIAGAQRLDDSLMTSLIARGFERIDCAVSDTATGKRRAELWTWREVGVHITRLTPRRGLPRVTIVAADRPWNHEAMRCEFSGSRRRYAEADSTNVLPEYPPMLLDAGILGEVSANFVVDVEGRIVPSTFKVRRSDNDLFTSAVKSAVARWRFRPASESDRVRTDTVDITVRFELPRELPLRVGLVTVPARLPDGPGVRVLTVSIKEDRDSTPVPSDTLVRAKIAAAVIGELDSLTRGKPPSKISVQNIRPFSAKAVLVDARVSRSMSGDEYVCLVQREAIATLGWRSTCRQTASWVH